MADDRTYIRVHDGLDEHPKVEPLSDAAFRLLMKSWFYCSRNRTDGRITDAVWGKRGTAKSRRELLEAGLAEQCDGHVQMHDYLEHQRSAEEIKLLKEHRGDTGNFGNHVRWHVVRRQPKAGCEHCESDPESIANAIANGSQTDRKTIASTEAETEDKKKTSSSLPRKRGSRIPEGFTPSPDVITWTLGQGFTAGQGKTLVAEFVDYWSAKAGQAATKTDWDATFRNWVRRADPSRVRETTSQPAAVQRLSAEQINNVLGPDHWTPPSPPPGLDPDERWEWERRQRVEHIEERQQQARARLGRTA